VRANKGSRLLALYQINISPEMTSHFHEFFFACYIWPMAIAWPSFGGDAIGNVVVVRPVSLMT